MKILIIKDITGYYEDELGKFCRYECALSMDVEESNIKLQLIENEVIKLEKDLVAPVEFLVRKHTVAICPNSYDIELIFSSKEDLNKCVKWIEKNNEKFKSKTSQRPNGKLVNWLILESFEKVNTSINKHLKLKPEDYLFQKIESFWEKSQTFYGYFSIVCQSTGFGKSRACQNLSEKAYVVFCCLRPKESKSGYPRRSYLADELTQAFYDDEKARKCYINYFNIFIDFLNKNPNISRIDFYRKFSNGFKDVSTVDQHEAEIIQGLKTLKENCCQTEELLDYITNEPLIFVFDEASSLLHHKSGLKNNYFILRSVISEFSQNKKIFVLFLDTVSTLSDFMPYKWHDPSKRATESHLIPPIYLLPNWDVFTEIDSIKTPQDSMLFENICSFGRPLWGSCCKTLISDSKYKSLSYKELVGLIKEKIVGDERKNINEMTDNDALAILSSRIGTIRPLLTSTAKNLVAMNMGVCVYANHTENMFKIEYPSEPIVANATAFYFNEQYSKNSINQSGYCFLINKLKQAVLNSIVDQGEKGETITKILLLKAYDNSVSKLQIKDPKKAITKYCEYVTVESFLINLYGIDALDSIRAQLNPDQSGKLLNGYVRFNHFVRAECDKEKLNFKNLMKRCCAIQTKRMQSGVDFIIPILYSFNENDFEKMSVIVIQTKLETVPRNLELNYLNSIKVNRSDIDNPFLVIFMQLGKKAEPFFDKNFNPKIANMAFLYSEGISPEIFRSIDADISNALISFSFSQNKSYLSGIDEKIADEIIFSDDNKQ